MSAPKTDLEKQEKRHKVPLVGMAWSIVWAVVLLIALVVYLTVTGNQPGDGESAGSGEVEQGGATTGESQ